MSAVPPPIRRLLIPSSRNAATSARLSRLKKYLPLGCGNRFEDSKLSPGKSAGTAAPGCSVSTVKVTGDCANATPAHTIVSPASRSNTPYLDPQFLERLDLRVVRFSVRD